jgi:hypothetical protein
MQGSFELELGGSVRNLRFNNFAHVQLSKALFENGHYVSNPAELLDKMIEMSSDNIALFMKALVFAGIIGHDYEVGFKATITQQEVGTLVANIGEEDLLKVWEVFMEAMGVNLGPHLKKEDADDDSEDTEKKK